MLKLYVMLKTFRDDRKGATAIEYGLIAAGIAVVIIVAVNTLGGDLNSMFETITEELGNTPG